MTLRTITTVATVMAITALLAGCSSNDGIGAAADPQVFCGDLSALAQINAGTADPDAAAQVDDLTAELQDVADGIALREEKWDGLGETTADVIAGNSVAPVVAYQYLVDYCHAHDVWLDYGQ